MLVESVDMIGGGGTGHGLAGSFRSGPARCLSGTVFSSWMDSNRMYVEWGDEWGDVCWESTRCDVKVIKKKERQTKVVRGLSSCDLLKHFSCICVRNDTSLTI